MTVPPYVENRERLNEFNPVVPTTTFPLDYPLYQADSLTALRDDFYVLLDGEVNDDFTITADFTDGVSVNGAVVFESPGITGNLKVYSRRGPRTTTAVARGTGLTPHELRSGFDGTTAALRDLFDDFAAVKALVGDGLMQISDVAVLSSVTALRALTPTLYSGTVAYLNSWQAGYSVGGGFFIQEGTDADDGGITFKDAGNRTWKRMDFRGVINPYWYGALPGASDQSAYFNAAHAAINANSDIKAIDVAGIWSCNGGLTEITRNKVVYHSSGYCLFTRLTDGTLLTFSGNNVRVRHVYCDGGGKKQSLIKIAGDDSFLFDCLAYNNSSGQGIFYALNADDEVTTGHIAIACEVYDVAAGGIGTGNANKSIFGFNKTWNITKEGIRADESEKNVYIANMGHDCGGIGFLAGNKTKDLAYIGNLGWNNHNGLSLGENRGGSENVTAVGNVFTENDNVGIWFKNKYAIANITGITRANPGVVTLASKAVTGVSNALPCVVTVVGHGLSDGYRVIHNNVGGATQINGTIYVIKKINNDSYSIWHNEKLTPIDSSAWGVYTAGGTMDHPFEVDDRLFFASVGGMTEINDNTLDIFVKAKTATTITLGDEDGNDFDTSAFTAYTTGGTVSTAGVTKQASIIGNVLRSNDEANIIVGWRKPLLSGLGHCIVGNQTSLGETYLQDNEDIAVSNRNSDFDAYLTSAVTNVTGNGTVYVILCQENYDASGGYNPANGRYTALHDGHYWFDAGVDMVEMGGATDGEIEIVIRNQFGTAVTARKFTKLLQPKAANAANSNWSAGISITGLFLLRGQTAELTVMANGLGADTADVNNGKTFFMGGLRG